MIFLPLLQKHRPSHPSHRASLDYTLSIPGRLITPSKLSSSFHRVTRAGRSKTTLLDTYLTQPPVILSHSLTYYEVLLKCYHDFSTLVLNTVFPRLPLVPIMQTEYCVVQYCDINTISSIF